MTTLSLSCVKVTQNGIKSVLDPAKLRPKGLIKIFLGPFISRFGSGTENASTMTGKLKNV